MNTSLESRKQDLAYKAIMRNLTTMTQAEQERLQNGLEAMPVHKVIAHAQYIQNDILPRIQTTKGLESEEYRNFKGMCDALIWCLHIHDLQDRLLYQYSNEKLLCEFYREKCIFYEQELMRYTTREDLLLGETFRATARAMVKRELQPAQECDATVHDIHTPPEVQPPYDDIHEPIM